MQHVGFFLEVQHPPAPRSRLAIDAYIFGERHPTMDNYNTPATSAHINETRPSPTNHAQQAELMDIERAIKRIDGEMDALSRKISAVLDA